MVHAVMAQAQPGEVLVLTMPEPRPVALVGELLATQAKSAHRDIDGSSTVHRRSRAVERGEEGIAGRIHLAAVEAGKFLANGGTVSVQ